MNKAENIFRTPFSTALSGSARETERRIRNIFLWKKKRPPVLVLVLAAVLIALCGGLVSCQERTEPVTLVMDTQYYDTQGNYIEIPALAMSADTQPTAGVTAINQALSQLKQEYQDILDGVVDSASLSATENHCLLYPTETQRYWNLVFFREEFHTDLNTGHVTSLVYNKETGQQVTLEEALELAGQTADDLCQALADQYNPTLGQDIPGADLCIQNQTVEGFRMGADDQPIFYLTARVDDRDDTASDFVSGSDNLYIWSGGTFTLYDQYTVTDLQPLVPSEECIDLNPPLWRQWNFSGGEPEGGFSVSASLSLQDPEVCLYRDGFPNPIGPGSSLSFSCLDSTHIDTQRLEEYEPIYNPGDYWLRSSGTTGIGSFTALSYYNSTEDRESINTLDVTMPDLYTPRGIRVGASREDRARRVLLYGVLSSLAAGLVMCWGTFFHGDVLTGIFAKDTEVIAAAAEYLKAYAIDCLLTSFLFCFIGYFNGHGRTLFVMAQGMIGALGVRLPMAFLMSRAFPESLFHLGLSTPASTAVQITLCILVFLRSKHRQAESAAT